MKKRALTICKNIGILIIIGIIYGIFVMNTGIGIPCIFNRITGYQCPGCGITRMCMALMRLDIKAAYHYNKMVFILSPVMLFVFASQIYRYIKFDTTKLTKVQSIIIYVIAALLVFWGLYRNI